MVIEESLGLGEDMDCSRDTKEAAGYEADVLLLLLHGSNKEYRQLSRKHDFDFA